MPIAQLHKIDQPREKLDKYGANKLSDAELLAIVLKTGPPGSGVLGLVRDVLSHFRHGALAQASIKDLMAVKGLGAAKACEIVACFELGRRLLKDKRAVLVLSPREVWEQCKDIRGLKKEHFVVFFWIPKTRRLNANLCLSVRWIPVLSIRAKYSSRRSSILLRILFWPTIIPRAAWSRASKIWW